MTSLKGIISGPMQTFCQIKLTLISKIEKNSNQSIFTLFIKNLIPDYSNFLFDFVPKQARKSFNLKNFNIFWPKITFFWPNFISFSEMTPKKRNRNLTSQIYQSQIQQSTSSGSDPDQKVRLIDFRSKLFEMAHFFLRKR